MKPTPEIPMTIEQSVRGMVTLLATYQSIIGVMIAVYPEMSTDALAEIIGMTDAAFEDAARYLPPGEARRIKARARNAASPAVREGLMRRRIA